MALDNVVIGLALALALAGCSGDPPPADNTCTGQPYDLCNDEHDCMSACKLFTAENIQVCTIGCTASTPCPNDSTGHPATCNANMVCEPAAANACHLN